MNLADYLEADEIKRLHAFLERAAKQHAVRHLTNIGSAAGLTRKQYARRFDVRLYQRAQYKWFNEHFKKDIYNAVLPTGAPDFFQPTVSIRENIFYGGVASVARRLFMSKVLKHLWLAMDEEWKATGAVTSPKAALYF